ncbi:MAG: alpha/beta fold hydrolase [Anaerolineales bacterium]|nr:alpha/beta fold hydrolase [Anaerolineales bacterium]
MKRGWRYYRNLLLFTLLCLVVAFYIVLPIISAYRVLHPTRYPLNITPADVGQSYEDVKLTTSDGVQISGWYLPSQNGAAVIALHAYNGNRSGTIYHADLLADNGYGVLMIDLRAHGQSGGELFPLGWDADRDVYAALDYLQSRPEVDPGRIGVLGLSIGAEVGLQAAARDARIQALVAEGASSQTFEDWMISPEPPGWILLPGDWVFFKSVELLSGVSGVAPFGEVVPQIAPRALFLIAAGDDKPFNRVYFAIAGDPKLYWERPEQGHIDAIFAHPGQYAEQVLEFYERSLLGNR